MNNMILRTLKNQIALSRACLEYDRYVKEDCEETGLIGVVNLYHHEKETVLRNKH